LIWSGCLCSKTDPDKFAQNIERDAGNSRFCHLAQSLLVIKHEHHQEQTMEKPLKQGLTRLKQREYEFTLMVENCSREDLAKCAKFLAMYIALYRRKFGEIPNSGYNKLITTPELDQELIEILDDGMYEAAEMLKLILSQKNRPQDKDKQGPYIN
jgi:hypothetical protein